MKELYEIVEKTKNLNMLFVEDSDIIRMSSVEFYEDIFNEVFIAVDGKDGLEIFFEHKDDIDLIITDISMPIMGGIEMAQKIREYSPNIPIFLLSAHSGEKQKVEIQDLNIQAFLEKPLNISNLINAIDKI